jgi:hypothetical protein
VWLLSTAAVAAAAAAAGAAAAVRRQQHLTQRIIRLGPEYFCRTSTIYIYTIYLGEMLK